MAKRIHRERKLTEAEAARLLQARAEFASKPTQEALLATAEYVGPMSIDDYLQWRKTAGDASLTKQLQAAIGATGESLYSIAQASGIAAPILQRFVNGERGITLDTASKLADYLGLTLSPRTGG